MTPTPVLTYTQIYGSDARVIVETFRIETFRQRQRSEPFAPLWGWDTFDPLATHVLARDANGSLVGSARINTTRLLPLEKHFPQSPNLSTIAEVGRLNIRSRYVADHRVLYGLVGQVCDIMVTQQVSQFYSLVIHPFQKALERYGAPMTHLPFGSVSSYGEVGNLLQFNVELLRVAAADAHHRSLQAVSQAPELPADRQRTLALSDSPYETGHTSSQAPQQAPLPLGVDPN